MDIIEAWTQVIVGSILIFLSNYFIFGIGVNMSLAMLALNSFIAFGKSYAVRALFKRK